MQFLILSSLISTASAVLKDIQDTCKTGEVVVRCQATTVAALEKCYKTTVGNPLKFDDVPANSFCKADADANATAITDAIKIGLCKQCFRENACSAEEEPELCPFSGTGTEAADKTARKTALNKCFATTLTRTTDNKSYVYNVKPLDTDNRSIKCGRNAGAEYTSAEAFEEVKQFGTNGRGCIFCAAKGTTPPTDTWKCPEGESKKACEYEEGEDEANKKCFKTKTGIKKVPCKEADKKNCEKCSAAIMGLFLAFAALLL